MMTPEVNPDGYAASGINNVTQFSTVDFLLAHGSADDNVVRLPSLSSLTPLSGIPASPFPIHLTTSPFVVFYSTLPTAPLSSRSSPVSKTAPSSSGCSPTQTMASTEAARTGSSTSG
jgi:hypothetical protein